METQNIEYKRVWSDDYLWVVDSNHKGGARFQEGIRSGETGGNLREGRY